MTHVKTADAFARLIDFCSGYGGTYNPGRPTLQLTNMVNKLKEARRALDQLIVSRAQYDAAVNARKQEFDKLPKLMASVMRFLESTGASAETLADARQYVKQVSGRSSRKKENGEATTDTVIPAVRSTLQLAYASKVDSFARLVQTVEAEPLYTPMESHLTTEVLRRRLAVLRDLNQKVSLAKVVWSNALIGRDQVLYAQSTSMIETGRAVQRYVRAIFGLNSPQYAQVKSLKFVKN